MKTMIPGMWVTVPKKRINSAPERPASLTQEWSASGPKPDTLLVHQSGHVSQFFDEWQFVTRGPDIFPKEKKMFSDALCDWGVFDSRTDTMVMISRVYDKYIRGPCPQSRFLLLWHSHEKNAGSCCDSGVGF